MSLLTTPSQTVGPYVSIGFTPLTIAAMAARDVAGERVAISGRVFDGDGKPVSDAVIEIWQANAEGRYAHPDDRQAKSLARGFRGFGRIPTDAEGAFRFTTIRPGRVPAPDGSLQASHLVVGIFMRGLLRRLLSRIYFPDDPAHSEDAVLKLVAPDRRATLIARRVVAGELEWDVRCQGELETVFLDC